MAELQLEQLKESRIPFIRWLDRQTESTRRIIQGIITTILAAGILATLSVLWAQRTKIADSSKVFWVILNTPTGYKILVVVFIFLLLILMLWVSILIGQRSRQEIQALKDIFVEYLAQDPRAREAVDLISNDSGYRFIADRLNLRLDRTVLLMLKSKTFDEFIANAGCQSTLNEQYNETLEDRALKKVLCFQTASMADPEKMESARLAMIIPKVFELNTAAHMHFDWSFAAFKKRTK